MLIASTSCVQTVPQQYLQVSAFGERSCSFHLRGFSSTLWIVVLSMRLFKVRKNSLDPVKILGVNFHMDRLYLCLIPGFRGFSHLQRQFCVNNSRYNLTEQSEPQFFSLQKHVWDGFYTVYSLKKKERQRD